MSNQFFRELTEVLKDKEQINVTIKKTGEVELTVMVNRNNKLMNLVGNGDELDKDFFTHFNAIPEVQPLKVSISDAPAADDDDGDDEPEEKETKSAAPAPKKEKAKGGKKKNEPAQEATAALVKEIEPEFDEACKNYLDAGDDDMSEGAFDSALDDYERALEMFPESLIIKEKIAAAKSAVLQRDETAKKNREIHFNELMERGNNLLKVEKKYDEAQKAFEAALEINPESTVALERKELAKKWVKAMAEL